MATPTLHVRALAVQDPPGPHHPAPRALPGPPGVPGFILGEARLGEVVL